MGFLQFHTRQDTANLLDGMTDAAKQAVGVKPKYAELKITLNFGNRVVVLPQTAEHVLSLLPLRSSHVRCSSPMAFAAGCQFFYAGKAARVPDEHTDVSMSLMNVSQSAKT